MTALLEQPFTIGIAGAAVAGVVWFFWLQTRHRRLLQAIPVVLLLTLGLLAIERMVQTDREAIQNTLEKIAMLVENNETAAALAFVHPSSQAVYERAAAELSVYKFQRAEIQQNLRIEVAENSEPQKATATFNAVVNLAEGTSGRFADRPLPLYLEVSLQKDGDDWRVLDFSVEAAMRGFQKKP